MNKIQESQNLIKEIKDWLRSIHRTLVAAPIFHKEIMEILTETIAKLMMAMDGIAEYLNQKNKGAY
jgi:hypothetical protein